MHARGAGQHIVVEFPAEGMMSELGALAIRALDPAVDGIVTPDAQILTNR